MYIEPNTNIRILKNVPLDNTYKHTITFASSHAQSDYFKSKTKHTLSNLTYQRVKRGYARVNIKAESLYDCNYMMFQNSSFGTKWFYAFITSVEYVNNEVSEIQFEIDVMQTWKFDYELRECFVVREHANSDEIGENLVPENLELGEYVSAGMEASDYLKDYSLIILATFDKDMNDATGTLYGGIYGGLCFNEFPLRYSDVSVDENGDMVVGSDLEAINSFIDRVVGAAKQDGIVSIYMMPSAFVSPPSNDPKSYSIEIRKHYTDFKGYTPRNNKLYTYPYNFLYVSNLEGTYAVYPYEYFVDDVCKFRMVGDCSADPSVIIIPNNYKGLLANLDEKLTIKGFPQCSWNTDTFKAYLAQASASGIGTVASALVKGAMNPAWGITSAVSSVADIVGQAVAHSVQPNQAHGSPGNSAMVAFKQKNFAFTWKHIRAEFAKIIDEYFDVYGYATHRVKIPNVTGRPYWNYVETRDCVITGSIPADDMRKICGIFNSGVTFWHNGGNIGNYSLDNTI